MELKVWVEGIQRIVCGVTETTTCQDVVFALAHATGKVGRFTLIEKWRNNERLLAPNENPLKILMKWGEYSSDVQFILQRSDQIKSDPKQQSVPQQQLQQNSLTRSLQPRDQRNSPTNGATTNVSVQILDRNKDIRKSFGQLHTDNKPPENIGIVKGIPQIVATANQSESPSPSLNESATSTGTHTILTTSAASSNDNSIVSPSSHQQKPPPHEFNTADVRNSLDRKTNMFREARNLSSESLLEAYNLRCTGSEVYKSGPPISSNGALVPPPYRDPPPPRTSPLHQKSDSLLSNLKKFEFKDNVNMNTFVSVKDMNEPNNEITFQNAQYRELIQLIKFQREKLNIQQADLTKFDAEIVYLESKEREQLQQLDAIAREIGKTDQLFRQGQEQLQTLQYVEEENELVHQQEKTLKSEITLLRSKLANCETELLQCKNKIRLILDDIQIEQRTLSRQFDNRQQLERHFLNEVERIQTEIDQAIHSSETSGKTMDNLKKEVAVIESAIAEKKKQVEQLVNEMKEVNLQSLAVAPSEEIRHLLEGGANRPGSTRRIIGSPRQLETAVPTSKNPHGVWV